MSSLEEFETKKGAQIADYAFGIDRTEGLNQVYGYLESSKLACVKVTICVLNGLHRLLP